MGVQISGMTSASTPLAGTELVELAILGAPTLTRKTTTQDIADLATGGAAQTHAATGKANPVDADELPLADSAAAYALKKVTAANLRAYINAPVVQSVTSASTVTPNFGEDLVKITAQAAALTIDNPAGSAIPAWGFVIRIMDNGTARAISYGTQYRAIGVTLPATTVVGKTLYIAGVWNTEDTKLDVLAVGQEA